MIAFKNYFIRVEQTVKGFFVFVKGFFVFVDEDTDKMIYRALGVAIKWAGVIGLPLLLIIAWLMGMRVDTHIRADFTVNRFSFVVKDPVELKPNWNGIQLKSMMFQSISVRKFGRIEMAPLQLSVKEADSTWRPVKLTGLPLIITAVPNALSKVTVATEEGNVSMPEFFGKLEGFSIGPGTKVVLETQKDNPKKLTIALSNFINNISSPVSLLSKKPFQLMVEYGQMSGVELSPQGITTFKVTLPELSRPYIDIFSKSNTLELSMTILAESEEPFPIFADDVIRMTALELFSVDRERKPYTALVEEGEISYIGYPEKENVSFKDTDFIRVGEGDELQMEKAIFDPAHPGIKLRVQGVVTQATLRSPNFPAQDLRLTFYDELTKGRFIKTIIENLEWIILAIISITGIILIEEFKKLVQNLARSRAKGEGEKGVDK